MTLNSFVPIFMNTCVVFLKNKFLEVELLGHRLFVLTIFIKTVNLFSHLSKTEYCPSLKFLLSDGQMSYLPVVFINFFFISSEVIGLCLSFSTIYLLVYFTFFFFY